MEQVGVKMRTEGTFNTCFVVIRDIKMITRKISITSLKFYQRIPLIFWSDEIIFKFEICFK